MISPLDPNLLIAGREKITGVFVRWLRDLVARVALRLLAVEEKAAAYTAQPWDMIPTRPTIAGVTITLPSNPSGGTAVFVRNVTNTANAIIVAAGDDDTIGGAASLTIAVAYGYILAIFDHRERNWLTIHRLT